MTLTQDLRYPYSFTISVKVESDLYEIIMVCYDRDRLTLSGYLREVLNNFFLGKTKANLERYQLYMGHFHQVLKKQIVFCVDRNVNEKLIKCSQQFHRKTPVIVRTILRQMYFGFWNEYRDYLMELSKNDVYRSDPWRQ